MLKIRYSNKESSFICRIKREQIAEAVAEIKHYWKYEQVRDQKTGEFSTQPIDHSGMILEWIKEDGTTEPIPMPAGV